jgi:hypothetical protein
LLIDGARGDFGARLFGTAAETEQIHQDFLSILECSGFQQRLFLDGMKRERNP